MTDTANFQWLRVPEVGCSTSSTAYLLRLLVHKELKARYHKSGAGTNGYQTCGPVLDVLLCHRRVLLQMNCG